MSLRHDLDPAAARQAPDELSEMSELAALSRLMDGEATPNEAAALCAAWKQAEPLRGRWHEWQLIGDVMRSDELAGSARRDQAMLVALRARLAKEPVPLAPQALQTRVSPAHGRTRQWLTPMAVAAGFVAVAGVLVVARVGMPDAAPQAGVQAMATVPASQPLRQTAQQTSPDGLGRGLASTATATAPMLMLRDAGLDRYVSAHRKAPLGAEMPGRAEPNVQFVRVEK